MHCGMSQPCLHEEMVRVEPFGRTSVVALGKNGLFRSRESGIGKRDECSRRRAAFVPRHFCNTSPCLRLFSGAPAPHSDERRFLPRTRAAVAAHAPPDLHPRCLLGTHPFRGAIARCRRERRAALQGRTNRSRRAGILRAAWRASLSGGHAALREQKNLHKKGRNGKNRIDSVAKLRYNPKLHQYGLIPKYSYYFGRGNLCASALFGFRGKLGNVG